MSVIKVMDAHLANMIAAGEVIERPSSVIKELVENSIDAKSKHIEVRLYDAGRLKIVVKDDGCGMDRSDAEVAFKRHASSKLTSERDLFRIKTMGFRGEALPSISSVSKVTMMTSDGVGPGTKVIIEDDKMRIEDCPSRKGTTFCVEELFYNTPVRLKFLKTDTTENANSLEVMQRLAMARTDIAFDFYIDDRNIFTTSGRGDLLEVIARIYSNDTARRMIPVKFEDFDFQVEGYIGKPEIAKSNRYYMITLLNERNVYVPKIQKAIIEAYGDTVFNTKYPFVVLKINVEHSLVDVNVHPSKKEVRLSNEDKMCDAIKKMIKDGLQVVKFANVPSFDKSEIKTPSDNPFINKISEKNVSSESQLKSASLLLDEDDSISLSEPIISRPTIEVNKSEVPQMDFSSFDESVSVSEDKPSINPIVVNSAPKYTKPHLVPIGTIHDTFIICQGNDGMYLVDQHAAAERINLEKFEKELNSKINIVEPLIPYVININPSDIMKLDEHRFDLLRQIGIECEEFGSNAIRVTRLPTFIKERNEEAYLEKMISQVLFDDRVDINAVRKDVLAQMACKASIRAGDRISMTEMNDLIDRLFECENPTTCAHGRPTIVHFSRYDIEKLFKRKGF